MESPSKNYDLSFQCALIRGITLQNYCIHLNLKRIRNQCSSWHMVAMQDMDRYSKVQRKTPEKNKTKQNHQTFC